MTEVAETTLAEIERVDPELGAFTCVDPGRVLAQAAWLDSAISNGVAVGPLAGVPLGVKDLFDVEGLPTSAGSEAFDPFIPPRDAAAVARLRAAGALVVGKTRTSEFAWSANTAGTRNPADPSLIPGGSSGGSAAAVGAGLVHAALGNDVGGSIRIPAALCGVVGIKPTYGVVCMAGTLPGHRSFDTAGPLARSVTDARLVLGQLTGDERLRAGLAQPREHDLEGMRLGVVEEPLFEIVEERARIHHERQLELLAEGGAALVRLRLPEAEYVEPIMFAIDPEGAATLTERLRDRRDDFGEEVRPLVHFAHLIPAVLLVRAHQARGWIVRRVARLFREHRLDALVAPANVAPAISAADLGLAFTRASGETEAALWGYARVFWLASVTGQPSVVVPTPDQSPPLGIQLVGRPFEDDRLLDLAAAVERAAVRPAEGGAV